jgi:hypothetical protein
MTAVPTADVTEAAEEHFGAAPPDFVQPPREPSEEPKVEANDTYDPERATIVADDAPKEKAKEEDPVAILIPDAEPREQKILDKDGKVIATYLQKPLTFFRKMQFFRLIARALKVAIEEGGPDAVADIFGGGPMGARLDTLTSTDVEDAGSFMRFVIAIVEETPEVLEEAYVIWLSVPAGQREWAKAAMRGDIEDVVPLSDEDAVAVVKTFVVQNWGAMQAFFTVHAKEVFEVAKAEQAKISPSDD